MAVLDRDGYRCVRCSAPIVGDRGDTWVLHHRRPRGMGGTTRADANSPANLLSLCAGCHGYVESERYESYTQGWLVHMHHDPAAVPVLHDMDGWVLLDDDGGSCYFLREYADG